MLKFARQRSNSAERPQQTAEHRVTSRFVQHHRDQPHATPPTPMGKSALSGRGSSLERCRRQLRFVKVAGIVPPNPSPASSAASSEDYAEVTSSTFCRARKATLAPLTPTLEKLSSDHVSIGAKPMLPPKSALKASGGRLDFHKDVEKLVEKLNIQLPVLDTSSESGYGSDDHDSLHNNQANLSVGGPNEAAVSRRLRGESCSPPPPLPRRKASSSSKHLVVSSRRNQRRVHFDSYVLLLQGLRERNLELVQIHVREVCREALATDEVMLEMMKAVLDSQELLVSELLCHGADPNFSDPSGLTPLHLAASVNALPLVKLLLCHGAAIFARAHFRGKTPSELCSPSLPGFEACHAYLRCMEECLGVANGSRVFAVAPYRTTRADELSVEAAGQELEVVRKGDYPGSSWWWCRQVAGSKASSSAREGYVLNDLLTLNRPLARSSRS